MELVASVANQKASPKPTTVFQHGDPSAVLIAAAEAARMVAIERSLSALHGLDVYPEPADDTAGLGSIVAGRERPTDAAIRRIARQARQILDKSRGRSGSPRCSADWPRSSTRSGRAARPRSTRAAITSAS